MKYLSELQEYKEIQHFFAQPPVDVEGMAQHFNIQVIREGLGDIAGEIRKTGNNEFVIVVNNSDPINRQRFTIAHELSHYLLHKDRMKKNDSKQRSFTSSIIEEEVQANKMAAQILMPLDLLQQQIDEGYNTVQTLAARLQVSEQSLRIRLNLQ